MLNAVQSPAQVEKILRHVGLWKTEEDVVLIRGPPGEALYPADDATGADFDAVDEIPADEGLAA